MTDAMLADHRLKIIRILLDALAELDPNPDSVKRRIKRIARAYDVSELIDSANLDDLTKDVLRRRFVQHEPISCIADFVGYDERTVRAKIDGAMQVLQNLI